MTAEGSARDDEALVARNRLMNRLRRGPIAVVSIAALLLIGCGSANRAGPRPTSSAAVQRALTGGGIDASQWRTDFSRSSVPLTELRSGGPGKDGIPAIDEPKFVPIARGEVPGREPVLVVRGRRTVKAYPLRILIWHEIVNDELDGTPVAVTYCPLCNSSVVFDRRVAGETVRFGTTGSLRRSDLVMWDDRTESWWQQVTGEAIVGRRVGTTLRRLPSIILSAAEAARLHPRAQVLSQDTGFDRDYGANPYVGYDDPASQPFLLDEKADPRLPAKERVLAVRRGRDGVVLPLSVVRERRVIAFDAFDTPVVALYAAGVTSALDRGRIEKSADVGSAVLFDARVADRRVKLRPTDESGRFAEDDGTIWDLAGRALSGPGKGQRLRPVASDEQFWFAYAAFLTGTVRIVR
jgi:hypothetical protein